MEEEKSIAARRGKWSKPGVPHKGWTCVDIEDLGEPSITCEMCETSEVRYVHHMEHPQYPEVLQAGCVCAGHMEQDLSASQAREAGMKSRAAKRKRWTSRKWKVSAKGNQYIKADGYQVTVYPRGGAWACTVSNLLNANDVRHSRRNFRTQDEAKLAGFDELTRIQAAKGRL